ncbi:MAG: S46 family peptidase [Bacteroidales bacterium]|nr:S46 family peptidase [Bacteroidales bacterium]
MKRILCAVLALAIGTATTFADEGMWMLPLLKKMNGKALKEAGCRLTPDEIYSINHNSLKDAIVQFGGGCTGEIVSKDGLLLTNHHCGYGSIQKLSSVDHDYLKDGYWAMNRSEELPVEGLKVTFLESMTDITSALEKVRAKAVKAKAEDPEKLVAEAAEAMRAAAEMTVPGSKAVLESFYNENVQYIIVYKVYNDVRFVGAPPSSIGKFGADTDNWMWPRHTCDFSMFRVYADKDNNPADYSPENVPYHPKRSLAISLKGVQEGDFTMIMGFPGRTTRFQTSPELQSQIANNDIRIAARTIKQNIMMEEMLADPAVKIQYASKYSGSSNGWKKWQGMKLAFDKLDIIGRARDEEAQFQKWADASKKRKALYGSVIGDISAAQDSLESTQEAFTLAYETLYQIEISRVAVSLFNTMYRGMKAGKDQETAFAEAKAALPAFYKDYCKKIDIREAKALLAFYRENAAESILPQIPGEDFATMDIDAYVDRLFAESKFASLETAEAITVEELSDDPALKLSLASMQILWGLQAGVQAYSEPLEGYRQTYTAGLLKWRKKQPSYPDANFTMRFTYGHVMPYSPKDAVLYRHFTTLDGVMEKEDPNNWEFVVPARLKEIWAAKDFGQYANPDGRMPACFLSNNDITGGNSGSPIMNADGELLGLAFDGNWESMSSDVMFEPELQRCINVDIRYVLLIVDKFGGAGWLLDEMDLRK